MHGETTMSSQQTTGKPQKKHQKKKGTKNLFLIELLQIHKNINNPIEKLMKNINRQFPKKETANR